MPAPKAYFAMTAYGDALYVFGGWNGGEVNTMERYSKQKGWEYYSILCPQVKK